MNTRERIPSHFGGNLKALERWIHLGPQLNGLQADTDGLRAIEQSNDHLFKLSYPDGSTIEDLHP